MYFRIIRDNSYIYILDNYFSGPTGHPIDFSRVDLRDLSPDVMEPLDDQDLDQYLPPAGMPLSAGHPHAQSHPGSRGEPHYSQCYPNQSGNGVQPSGWANSFRPNMASNCMPPHYMVGNSVNGSSGTVNNTITPPYDLSEHNTTRSPSSQTSPPSFLNPTTPSSDCKYRDEDPNCQQVKMEQMAVQQQQQAHHQQQQEHQQRYCDPKFDGFDVASTVRYGNGAMDGSVHFPPPMHGPYLSQGAVPVSGSSAASGGYQYNVGLHRQMFNPIAAAVPGEQGWERYT